MKCIHCHQAFDGRDELEGHLRSVHRGSANKVAMTCISCGLTTTELTNHMRDTHLGGQRNYSCRVCKKQFLLPALRNRHEYENHTKLECDAAGLTRMA